MCEGCFVLYLVVDIGVIYSCCVGDGRLVWSFCFKRICKVRAGSYPLLWCIWLVRLDDKVSSLW